MVVEVERKLNGFGERILKQLKFPENFDVKWMDEDDYLVIVNRENLKWGVIEMHILVVIKDRKVGYETTICIGKEVVKTYGEEKDVVDEINYHICKYFREKAKENNLYYKY